MGKLAQAVIDHIDRERAAELKAREAAAEKARADKAKAAQDYDPDPPRCFTCLYFKRINMARKMNRQTNATIDRCKFGNFLVSYNGVCDEWRTKSGDRLEPSLIPMRLVTDTPPHGARGSEGDGNGG